MYKFRDEKDGGSTNRYPVDTSTELWIQSSTYPSMKDLMNAASEKWPDIAFEDISIESVHHHQYCIYYDLHDSSDYVDYILLSVEETK